MRIMVIDDQPDVLETIGGMLRLAGHDVTLAAGGKSGLFGVERDGFEVLVTDMLMPEVDGVEVIKALRRSHPNLWIVAISGGGRQVPADMSLKLSQAFGADKMLYKPVKMADLLASIKKT
jgi:DNA-binding response OmpR family regulator